MSHDGVMGKFTGQLYEHFDFAEQQGTEAVARLQFLCDLINNPPVWLNKEGVEAFLLMP